MKWAVTFEAYLKITELPQDQQNWEPAPRLPVPTLLFIGFQMKWFRASTLFLSLIAIELFCIFPPKAMGQDSAQTARKGIPYDSVYRVVRDQKEVKREGWGTLEIRISDKAGKIPSDKITLKILSVGAFRKIEVNKDGTFELPSDLKLKEENPPIISNLPIGRTKLDVVYLYSVDEANKRFYQPLSSGAGYGDLLREVKKEYTRLQNMLAKTSQDCQVLSKQVEIESRFPSGITLKIKRATGKYVVVRAKSGDLKFPVTPEGNCPLPIRPDLLQENPPLQIPGENWTWRIDYDEPSVKSPIGNLNTI